MRFRGASTHERIHQLDQNVKNSENENGPVNLDTETLIRAFGGKRAFYFYLYFLYPVQLGSSWKQDGGYVSQYMLFPHSTLARWPSLHSLKIYFKNHHCMSARVLHHASLVAQMVKNPPAMQETWVWSLGQEDSLEEEMATHSSILAWEIQWTEEPGGLQSMRSQRDMTEQLTFLLHFTSARALHHTSPVMGVITVIYRWGNWEPKYHAQDHRGSKL